MRKLFTLLTLSVLFCVINIQKAEARARIPTGNKGKVIKLIELPDEEAYRTKYGEHFDLGLKYTVFHIGNIPIWTVSSPELVGYRNKNSYTAIPLTEEEIQFIATANKIDNIHELVRMPFWDAWGGKFVMTLISALYARIMWWAIKKFQTESIQTKKKIKKESIELDETLEQIRMLRAELDRLDNKLNNLDNESDNYKHL